MGSGTFAYMTSLPNWQLSTRLSKHELIESLAGVEVVADYFAVIGCRSTMEATLMYHEHNLLSFLKRCEETKHRQASAAPDGSTVHRTCGVAVRRRPDIYTRQGAGHC